MPMTNELIINTVLLLLLVVIAVASIRTRNLITSVILLAIFSLVMAMEYLILAAPDVAMTEAAVGAGISTIFILSALLITGYHEKISKRPLWLVLFSLLAMITTGAALTYASLGLPLFGDGASPANSYLVSEYIKHTRSDIGITNVVTAILASFRGFDTFGETVVIFGAGLSVYLLLGRPPYRKKHKGSL